jgi:hypothetical protein
MAPQSVAIESTIPQAEDEWIRQSCGFYACPVCKPRSGSGARRAFLPCLCENLPHPERDSRLPRGQS